MVEDHVSGAPPTVYPFTFRHLGPAELNLKDEVGNDRLTRTCSMVLGHSELKTQTSLLELTNFTPNVVYRVTDSRLSTNCLPPLKKGSLFT